MARILSKDDVRRTLGSRLRDRGLAYITILGVCDSSDIGYLEGVVASVLEKVEKSCVMCRIDSALLLLLHGVNNLDAVKEAEESILRKVKLEYSRHGMKQLVLSLTFEISSDYPNANKVSHIIFHSLGRLAELQEQSSPYFQ